MPIRAHSQSMINDINDLPNGSNAGKKEINDINEGPSRRNAGWQPGWIGQLESSALAVNERIPALTVEWLMKHLQIEVGMAVRAGWLQVGDNKTPYRAAKWATHNTLKTRPRSPHGYFRACFRDFLASEGPVVVQPKPQARVEEPLTVEGMLQDPDLMADLLQRVEVHQSLVSDLEKIAYFRYRGIPVPQALALKIVP